MRRKSREPNVTDVYIKEGDNGYIAASESDAICEATGYSAGVPICTREPNHEGPHVAHSVDDCMLAVWPREAA